MRIGIDARLWAETGVGRYIRNLVKHLQILDRENDYILFVKDKDQSDIKSMVQSPRFKVINSDIQWHSFKEQWAMPKILGQEKLDLVHFPYFNVPIFYREPFVVTIHDLIINHFPTGRATTLPWPFYQIKRSGYKLSLNHALKKSKKIIAVSKATKYEILSHFNRLNPNKINVIYESGELETDNQESQSDKHELVEKPFLLYVGNAHPHKNLEKLLEAIQKLKSQKSNLKITAQKLKLVLVGKEDFFYQRLERFAEEMDLKDQIIFYGEAADRHLRDLYKNATALILPSLMEGFGLPALEAMGHGCLVLASDIPAFREVCGKSAIYFDPSKVDEITLTIQDALTRPQNSIYQSKISDGLRRSKTFSWEKMARETLRVYEQAAK